MSGSTISNTVTHGIVLGTVTSGGTYASPLTITSAGAVEASSGDAIYGPGTQAWTVVNQGSVIVAGTTGDGIDLTLGGSVDNAGLIDAPTGVSITGVAGTVTNSGTIAGTGTHGYGVLLFGGAVTNGAGALIAGYRGVLIGRGGLTGTVSNYGTIEGGTSGNGYGVLLYGGAATNGAGALISGAFIGIVISGSLGTVSNLGTIDGTGTFGRGVDLGSAGGSVTNGAGALIAGYVWGVSMGRLAAGTVGNLGTIESTGTAGTGVYLGAGGSVTNASGGVILGALSGVEAGGAGTVSNYGVITGTVYGVRSFGANVTNASSAALIAGGRDGVFSSYGGVANFGTIEGTGTARSGVYLASGGSVSNGAPTALITGYGVGVFTSNVGTVSNLGTIEAGGIGVQLNSGGTVANLGTIQGTRDVGVRLLSGGSITNGATTALISGAGVGAYIVGGAGSVSNSGTIEATGTSGYGILLGDGGNVRNAAGGLIQGARLGVYAGAAGTVVNYGTIIATGPYGSAVDVRYGVLINHGLVEGTLSGIQLGGTIGTLGSTGTPGSGQVTVYGTVVGPIGISTAPTITAAYTVSVGGTVIGNAGTAVSLTPSAANRLIVMPGAAFTGVVDGGGGTSVLEIAAAGTVTAGGLGAVGAAGTVAYVTLGSVANFSALQIDPSATFGGVGALGFATLFNEGQINIGSGNSLALGSVASAVNTGTIDLETGGLVDFRGMVTNQVVIFNPAGGTAAIEQAGAFAGTLAGFTSSLDIADLTGLAFSGNTSVGFDQATDVLTVTEGAGSATIQLATGIYTGVTWQASADASTGTDVAPVCFCRGTLILTERGEVPVEALAVGDRAVTLSGKCKPIRWIGFGRDLVTARNSLARPIVVRAGALADNVPRRDLYLTHGHALYVDGVLIPVEHLVNHRSIHWDAAARVVEYYHIELDDHDVVLAEGAPAESYYDSGNRALFHNTRPGSQPGGTRPTVAPVLNGGELVGRIWADLHERAGGRLERDTTDDPDLHLVIDGERLDPISVADCVYSFAVQRPPAERLLLRSRSAVPSLTGISRHDHRRLGVAIRQIILCAPGVMTSFDHAAPPLRAGGCHEPEGGHAWTDGELTLPARLFAHLRSGFSLIVNTQRQSMRYSMAATLVAAAERAAA